MIWLTIALVYCFVCWLLGCAVSFLVCPPQDEDVEKFNANLAVFLTIVIMPLLVPVILWRYLFWFIKTARQIRVLQRVSRTMREFEFLRVNFLYLEEPVRRHFETHTPPLLQLGFDLIGDFRMKPEPVVVHDRLFLSADGEVFADLCALLDSGAVSLLSILEDGTCVHTCSVEDPHPERTFEPADRLCMTYMPDASVPDLHRHHANILREQMAWKGSPAIRFCREQFREILIYDQNLFNRWLYRHGGLDREPPRADLQTLIQPAASSVIQTDRGSADPL
jgi:hypothetical protein